MNREDIIRMARVAGCHDNGEEFRFVELRYLERFAALVAAAEREACAGLAERRLLYVDNADLRAGYDHACKSIADAIRTRGQG